MTYYPLVPDYAYLVIYIYDAGGNRKYRSHIRNRHRVVTYEGVAVHTINLSQARIVTPRPIFILANNDAVGIRLHACVKNLYGHDSDVAPIYELAMGLWRVQPTFVCDTTESVPIKGMILPVPRCHYEIYITGGGGVIASVHYKENVRFPLYATKYRP